jgi:hypothetical protein
MEKIDRKFSFVATSIKSGKNYTHRDAIVFLAKDALLPDLLDKYVELCAQKGAGEQQIKGAQLLKDRVLKYQRINMQKVKLPDVEEGKEEKKVCKRNT